jgi:hypothetical protein
MWITRFALPFALAVAVMLGFLAPRDPEPAATIPARELVSRAQQLSGKNYTFDQRTGAALADTQVPRPPQGATKGQIESALREAGFVLVPVGTKDDPVVFKVERIRG